MELDVRDTEYVWCSAMVRVIVNVLNKGEFIVVHYLGWSNIYDEAIESTSRRLAKKGFYCKRRGM